MKRYLKILERYVDEWLNDGDWWYGFQDCDINVCDNENGSHSVVIYGLTPVGADNGEVFFETNTSDVIDSFIIKGVE